MAPRKVQVWMDSFPDLLRDHNIVFEGPRQPGAWPHEHKHTFRIIRDIWAIRYNSFWASSKLSRSLRLERQNILNDIVKNARTMRHANEDTWRGLEQHIMRMFSATAVCRTCKHELYVFEHEAEPFDRDKAEELKRRRQRRIPCTCRESNDSMDNESQDQDDVQPIIFCTKQSHPMTHRHLDKFDGLYIPMEPDRTVGLSASPRMQQALWNSSSTLDHYPLKGKTEVLYPFLLIEAKRALKTPGFAAIEAQTAFPLRRLLLLQDALRQESGVMFHPLVWFFANQGEEWRLYAGTVNEDKMHVYDLWHGTVESLDGSLQIFLIVEYIWTWARDVYRPQIRDCLCSLAPSLRDVTPSTLRSLSRSQSVLSETRSIPLRPPQVDVVMEEGLLTDLDVSPSISANLRSSTFEPPPYLPEISAIHGSGPSQTGVCHADLVEFSFRCTELLLENLMLPNAQAARKSTAQAFELLLAEEAIAIIKWRHIHALGTIWTGELPTKTATQAAKSADNQWEVVSFRFSSFCKQENWQIVRRLDCFIWKLPEIQDSNKSSLEAVRLALRQASILNHSTSATRMLSTIRDLSGEKSVLCALYGIKLTMVGFLLVGASSSTRWAICPSADNTQVDDCSASLPAAAKRRMERSKVTTIVHRAQNTIGVDESAIPLPESTGQKDGILAVKPQSWPARCSKFCLFVLIRIETSDRRRLGGVLREVINKRIFYGPQDEQTQHQGLLITQEDRVLLLRWLKSLESNIE